MACSHRAVCFKGWGCKDMAFFGLGASTCLKGSKCLNASKCHARMSLATLATVSDIDSTTPKHPTPTFFTQMIDVVPTGPTRKLEYFAGGFKRFNRNELQQLVIRRPTYTHSIKARTSLNGVCNLRPCLAWSLASLR